MALGKKMYYLSTWRDVIRSVLEYYGRDTSLKVVEKYERNHKRMTLLFENKDLEAKKEAAKPEDYRTLLEDKELIITNQIFQRPVWKARAQ